MQAYHYHNPLLLIKTIIYPITLIVSVLKTDLLIGDIIISIEKLNAKNYSSSFIKFLKSIPCLSASSLATLLFRMG